MIKKCITDFDSKDSRKVFEGILQYQINLFDRYYSDDMFSLLIIQIEDIKKHPAPVQDVIRKEVGTFLLENSRNSDVVAPLSSDKFAIISAKTNLEEGMGFAKKIKTYSDGKRFILSIGIGEYDNESKEEFLMRVNNLLSHKVDPDTKGHLI
jgi:GGDEF domain-containing protein